MEIYNFRTYYRFAEVEIYYAISHLSVVCIHKFQPRTRAADFLLDALGIPPYTPEYEAFYEFFHNGKIPAKKETICALLNRGYSIPHIVKFAKTSPNTIVSLRKKPIDFKPEVSYWTEPILNRWNLIYPHLKIFD